MHDNLPDLKKVAKFLILIYSGMTISALSLILYMAFSTGGFPFHFGQHMIVEIGVFAILAILLFAWGAKELIGAFREAQHG